jgi:hypothetical protein
MDIKETQIAIHVLENLREDLVFAHLNNGRPLLFVADIRQYIYEHMGRLRTNALLVEPHDGARGAGPDISPSHVQGGEASGKNLAKVVARGSEAGH